MFVFKLKVPAAKILIPIMAVLSIITAIVCVISMTHIMSGAPSTATCDELGTYTLTGGDTKDQIDFLNKFKITADPKSKKTRNVTIPAEFNEVYNEYNKLQNAIGLDLVGFKGKTAQEVTYEITNGQYKFAVLLICDSRVIGAHLTNGEYGGKNAPLTKLWTDLTK